MTYALSLGYCPSTLDDFYSCTLAEGHDGPHKDLLNQGMNEVTWDIPVAPPLPPEPPRRRSGVGAGRVLDA